MIGIDGNFPMTRTQRRILIIGFAVWAAVGIVLFGGFLPGFKPSFSTTGLATIDGRPYHFEYSQVRAPLYSNYTSPWNVTFFNVTFELWLTDWYSLNGGVLHGIGTEPNGTSYPFVLGKLLPNGTRPLFFLAPDLSFGVGWNGGLFGGIFAQLYVEA